jgi:chromosomal replication initiation ATPase DnaA
MITTLCVPSTMPKGDVNQQMMQEIQDFQKHIRSKYDVTIDFVEIKVNGEQLSLRELEQVAVQYSGIENVMRNKTRKREYVKIRQIIFSLAYKMDYSLHQIGAFFGGWDHSTVLHSKNHVMSLLEIKDKDITVTFNGILKLIKDLQIKRLSVHKAKTLGEIPPSVFVGMQGEC